MMNVDGRANLPVVNQPNQVNRLSIRTPPFWKINPQLWFRQVEGQFTNAGIVNDLTKFNTIIGVIDSEILSTVSDIVLNPPAANIYETLKQRLIKQFTDSDSKKLKTLLNDIQIGDMKPSDLLRKMRELSCNKVGDDLLKELWIQRLPSSIKTVVSSNDGDLDILVPIADRIFETAQINVIHTLPNPNDELLEIVQNLTQEINSLKINFRNRSRSKERFSQKPKSRHDSSSKICWYHKVYKDKATKCTQPCSFINHSENSEGHYLKRQMMLARK